MNAARKQRHVRPAGPDGLQGDRGRLPGRQPDRLRLRPRPHRERPHPRRRTHLGADPGPRGADRAHRAVARRAPSRPPCTCTTPPRRCSAASSSASSGDGRERVQGRRGRRHPGGHEVRRELPARHRLRLRVLARDLHGHRARLLAGDLRGRHGRLAARRRPRDRAQPALHGRALDAERLRRPDRVDVAATSPAASTSRLSVHTHNDRGTATADAELAVLAGARARRGLPVRQRRALRQRRPGDARPEPVQPGHRPDDRLQRHRRDPAHRRVLQPHRRARAAPVRRRPRLHVVLRLAPGRDQEGLRRPRAGGRRGRASRSARCRGTCPTCRSTRRTSAGPTRP